MVRTVLSHESDSVHDPTGPPGAAEPEAARPRALLAA